MEISTSELAHALRTATKAAKRLRVALYAHSDIDALTKREQSRRDVEQKRMQLRKGRQ